MPNQKMMRFFVPFLIFLRIGALGAGGSSDTDARNPMTDIDEPLTQKKGDIAADSNPEDNEVDDAALSKNGFLFSTVAGSNPDDNEVDDAALKEKRMVTEITAPSLRIGGAAMAFA